MQRRRQHVPHAHARVRHADQVARAAHKREPPHGNAAARGCSRRGCRRQRQHRRERARHRVPECDLGARGDRQHGAVATERQRRCGQALHS
eukprot:28736-Chlamydomonas_euryale.AAC.3